MASGGLHLCLNCSKYKGDLMCKECVDRRVAQDLATIKKKITFLKAYKPHPLSELFRGDVTFLGSDQEPVFAHRCIMAGRSKVFQKMFDINMKEKKSGKVQVGDAVAPVLRSMVNYCYTAEISFTKEAPAEEVLKLAHKYEITDLKAVCESELSRNIDLDNICHILRLARVYDAKKLDAEAAKFFKENFDHVYTKVVDRLAL